MTTIPTVPFAKPKIKGVEVDKDLANAVFLDDMMVQLERELAVRSISARAFLSIVFMFVPAMAGTLLTMFANLQIALMSYFGGYTFSDMLLWTVAFYMGFTIGPILSILVYVLITIWALRSFQGLIVIRVTGRNPSGSKTVQLDYIGEQPKPMRKPKMDELGERFTAFMREEITKLHTGIPVEEVQANINRMMQRFAEAYAKKLEQLQGADAKFVTRKVMVVKTDKEGQPQFRDDGMFDVEELSVKTPVYRPRRSRLYRYGWYAVALFLVFVTIMGIGFILYNVAGINIFRIIFGWLPIWG